MKNIYFKTILWIAIIVLGVWGYWQFLGAGSGGNFFTDSILMSEVGMDNGSSSSSLPTLSDTANSGVLVRNKNDEANNDGGLITNESNDVGNDSSASGVDDIAQNSANAPSSDDLITDSPNMMTSAMNNSPDVKNPITGQLADNQQSQTQMTPQVCSIANATASPSPQIIFNEIAWMGSLPQNGETAAKAGNREWIELKNISSDAVAISGWQILDSAGNLKIVLGAASSTDTKILPGGFYLLVRDAGALPNVQTDMGYSGGLSNAGDKLALFDPNCGTSDFLDASAGWPGGDNITKQTLERDANGVGWHTSVLPGGTPRAENSVPMVAMVSSSVSAAQTSTIIIAPSLLSTSLASVSVSLIGNGIGIVSTTPAGIFCGFNCAASYPLGAKINFIESSEPGSFFKGWSGACGGSIGDPVTQCSFTVSSPVAVVAEFDTIEASSSDVQSASTAIPIAASTTTQDSINHLLITAVQIAGASSSNDFVKIFNPTSMAIDLNGWKLRKKSNTGTDYSLRTFANGSLIASGGYFAWANSEGDYAKSINADSSSTETLSADNSVALMDSNGVIADQVAWGTGLNQYVEGDAYPTDPMTNQILLRRSANGVYIDADDNATDFVIQ